MNASAAFLIAEKKKKHDNETYVLVCKFIEKKIATAATLGKRDTMCEVPVFIPDSLQFDMQPMVLAVSERFQKLGYYVLQVSVSGLYISWRHARQPVMKALAEQIS